MTKKNVLKCEHKVPNINGAKGMFVHCPKCGEDKEIIKVEVLSIGTFIKKIFSKKHLRKNRLWIYAFFAYVIAAGIMVEFAAVSMAFGVGEIVGWFVARRYGQGKNRGGE